MSILRDTKGCYVSEAKDDWPLYGDMIGVWPQMKLNWMKTGVIGEKDKSTSSRLATQRLCVSAPAPKCPMSAHLSMTCMQTRLDWCMPGFWVHINPFLWLLLLLFQSLPIKYTSRQLNGCKGPLHCFSQNCIQDNSCCCLSVIWSVPWALYGMSSTKYRKSGTRSV